MRDGKFISISSMMELDQRSTEMLTHGVLDRVHDKSRINCPMVRISFPEGWQTGTSNPELRGKEEMYVSTGTPH